MQNIVLLHGALGAAQDLAPLGAALKEKGLAVFSFSFSGHGQAAFQASFSINQFTAELENFMHQHRLSVTHILGYSMGGYMALNFAAKQPQMASKIITLGTKFNWDHAAVEKETSQLNPDIIPVKVPAFAALLEKKHGPTWKELLHKTAEMMHQIGSDKALSEDVLKQLQLPVLLGLADKDQMVSLDETRQVFKQLPNAAMYMLPRGKHQLETIDINLLSSIIVDFIHRR